MVIKKNRTIEPETDEFRLQFNAPVLNLEVRLSALFRNWMERRQAEAVCSCSEKRLQVLSTSSTTADVLCGWFCNDCLRLLEAVAVEAFPGIKSITIGSNLGSYSAPDIRFIEHTSATAEFEDGTQVRLPPFAIRRSPISIGEFEVFTSATGYITSAEKLEDGSFRLDETTEVIRPKDRGNVPVHHVSYNDALAYCEWANVRLPSEAELLAAALIEQRVLSPAETRSFLYGKTGRFDVERYPQALIDLTTEWVVGKAPGDQAVTRRGPWYVRQTGWQKKNYRLLCNRNIYDLMIGFRICR